MHGKAAARLVWLSVAVTFAAYAAATIPLLIRAYSASAPYWIADWQINYSGGFVRRGLFGEVARQLFVHFALDSRATVVGLQVISYLVFFGVSALLVAPALARHPLLAFPVFSPMTFGFKALDPGSVGAKETLFLALLAVQATLSIKSSTRPGTSGGQLLAVALGMALVVLLHEGLFYFLPFSILLLVLTSRESITASKLAAVFTPALIAFLLSVIFHGDDTNTAAICASLGASAPARCLENGAIAWVSRTPGSAVMSTYYQVVQPPYILNVTAITATLCGFGLAIVALDEAIAGEVRRVLNDRLTFLMATACAIAPLPLFLLSDHGRYLHIWMTCAVIALVTLVSIRVAPPAAERAPRSPSRLRLLASVSWVLLFLGYATSWSSQGPCCPDRLGTGVLGRLSLLARELKDSHSI